MNTRKSINLTGFLDRAHSPRLVAMLIILALSITVPLVMTAPPALATTLFSDTQPKANQEKVISLSADPNGPVSSQFTTLFDGKVIIPNQQLKENLWVHNQGDENAYLSILLFANGISSNSQALADAISIGASINGATTGSTFTASDSSCTVLAVESTPLAPTEKQPISIELNVGDLDGNAGQTAALEINLVAVFTAAPLDQGTGDLVSCSGLPLYPIPEESSPQPQQPNSTENASPSQSIATNVTNAPNPATPADLLAKTGTALFGILIAVSALLIAFIIINGVRRKVYED